MTRRVIIGLCLIFVVVIAAIVALILRPGLPNQFQNSYTQPLVDTATLDGLEKKKASSASTSHISAGLIPPTNSWISGMVLQATPLPVYPMPNSFLAKENGFEIGLPDIQSSPDTITGGHQAGLSASIESATGFQLSRYDKVSATLTYFGGAKKLGNVTLAQGSPFIFYRSTDASTFSLPNVESVFPGSSVSYLAYTIGSRHFVITARSGAKIFRDSSTIRITAPKNSLVTFYTYVGDGDDALRDFAGNELRSVDVTHSQDGKASTTQFHYRTTNDRPTVFAPMPYSHSVKAGTTIATYDSIYGPMKAYRGTSFTTEAPLLMASNMLDVSHLSATHRAALIGSLKKDVETTVITAKDSYFGGKQLARAATLLDISEQLGQTETSSRIRSLLRIGFEERLGAQSFYYDTALKGIAAENKSFGSEDFNDHHFHYGYLIYAASILGHYDSEFLTKYQKQITLLVADIASYNTSEGFPVQRNYDPYSGHSWAAGLAPFGDGNNQESSSEAINAWNAVAKWAQLIGNSDLETTATWMLSNEAATAAKAWRSVDTSSPNLQNYSDPIVSLAFGGKRTYATFFSDEPNAKLGIQLLPMSPVMAHLTADGAKIEASVGASIPDDNFNVTLGDYILMYLALHDPQRATALLDQQTTIDDGNSQAYVKAWIFARLDTNK